MELLFEYANDVEVKRAKNNDVIVEGLMILSNRPTRNQRLYSERVVSEALERGDIMSRIENKTFLGELFHSDLPHLNSDKVSHIVEALTKVPSGWYGRARLLNHGAGLMARELLSKSARLGFSTKASGNVVKKNNIQHVENLNIHQIDLVPNAAAGEGTERYRRVERFVEALFTKWEKFREPPRHPKWRDVNLAASVPGWTRWSVAEEMLKRIRPKDTISAQATSGEFAAFLNNKGSPTSSLTDDQREALFREFLQWQERQRAVGQPR